MLRRLLFVVALGLVVTPMMAFASANSGQGSPDPGSSDPVAGYARSLYYFTMAPAISRMSQVPSHAVGSSQQTAAEIAENSTCQSFYSNFAQKNVVRMHASFGYFDDSRGKETVFNGTDFGMNASMDHAYLLMMRQTLTARCEGRMRFCGFNEVGNNTFRKTVVNPQNGQQVAFELQMEDSSLTPYYLTNTQERASEQQAKSDATRSAFMNAVENDDAVFYFGHSRNGGGPDFLPVKLMSNGHPNYRGYYEVVHPGFKDLLSAVRARGSAPPVLGLFSCYSEFWFGRQLLEASPKTGFMFTQSDKLSGADEHFAAGVATMDSLMRFQCFDGMEEELLAARKDPDVHELIRNYLSHRSPVNTHSHIPSVPD